MVDKIQYSCQGDCGTVITVEQYNQGSHVCQADGCSHFGQPYMKQFICPRCNEAYYEGEDHICKY